MLLVDDGQGRLSDMFDRLAAPLNSTGRFRSCPHRFGHAASETAGARTKSRPALKRTVRPAGELLGLSPPAAPREIVLLDAVLVNAYNTYFVDHTRSERSRSRLSWSSICHVANPLCPWCAEGSRRPVGCQVSYVVRFRLLCRAVEVGVRPTAASMSAWAAWRASANTVLSLQEAASAFAPS